jgi:2-dehydropantoate 2-reductase
VSSQPIVAPIEWRAKPESVLAFPGIVERMNRRYVVFGAGAVGGVIAGHLQHAGLEVTVIARGRHLEAIQQDGLTVETPEGSFHAPVPAVASPEGIAWADGDVVLLTMKSQDTAMALDDLAAVAPASLVVVCAQNGVSNEPAVLRRFEQTLGGLVIVPATHLTAGVVRAESSPCPGILDVGRYPAGEDEVVEEVATTLREAGFDARAIPDVMRWKYAKLLANLSNALDALCSSRARAGKLAGLLRAEGIACLAAAGIAHASDDEDRARRGDRVRIVRAGGEAGGGSSTWQSLQRRTGSVEVDFLNGEIVLLGRLHGVPTPANALIQRLANQRAREGAPPRTEDERSLLAQLGLAG